MVISDEVRITGDIGGQPKQVYWTPDGRVIRAMPDIHEFIRRNAKGQIIESGTRDANYDKGWLQMKPTELKLYCPHCDRWHDTKKEIADCEREHRVLVKKSLRQANALRTRDNLQEQNVDNNRITQLEADMGEIKGLLQQLLQGVNHGAILQRTGNESKTNTGQQNDGADEKGMER